MEQEAERLVSGPHTRSAGHAQHAADGKDQGSRSPRRACKRKRRASHSAPAGASPERSSADVSDDSGPPSPSESPPEPAGAAIPRTSPSPSPQGLPSLSPEPSSPTEPPAPTSPCLSQDQESAPCGPPSGREEPAPPPRGWRQGGGGRSEPAPGASEGDHGGLGGGEAAVGPGLVRVEAQDGTRLVLDIGAQDADDERLGTDAEQGWGHDLHPLQQVVPLDPNFQIPVSRRTFHLHALSSSEAGPSGLAPLGLETCFSSSAPLLPFAVL